MNSNTGILTIKDLHFIKKSIITKVDKLHYSELNSFFITNVKHKPTPQFFWGKIFPNEQLD